MEEMKMTNQAHQEPTYTEMYLLAADETPWNFHASPGDWSLLEGGPYTLEQALNSVTDRGSVEIVAYWIRTRTSNGDDCEPYLMAAVHNVQCEGCSYCLQSSDD
jgi:hypothetical protein